MGILEKKSTDDQPHSQFWRVFSLQEKGKKGGIELLMRLTKNKHLESKLHFGVMKTIIAISLIQSVPKNNFVRHY